MSRLALIILVASLLVPAAGSADYDPAQLGDLPPGEHYRQLSLIVLMAPAPRRSCWMQSKGRAPCPARFSARTITARRCFASQSAPQRETDDDEMFAAVQILSRRVKDF